MDFLSPDMNQMTLPGIDGGPRTTFDEPRPVKKEKKQTTADILKSGQLPMFLTPKEIQENYYPLPGDFISPDETREDLWKRKAKESSEGSPGDSRKKTSKETLTESIAKEGVKHPITLAMDINKEMGADKPFVYGGHHRVAAAAQVNPNMLVPVVNAPNFFESDTAQRADYHAIKEGRARKEDFNVGSGERLNY